MVVNGQDITPDPAGVYVGNNAVSSDVGWRTDYNRAWWAGKDYPGVLGGSLWFVSDNKVTRLDPVTGAFQSEITLPPGYVGIDIMPSGSWTDAGVIWCYCRRIFIDDVCRIVIDPADNSFNEVASVTMTLDSNWQGNPTFAEFQAGWDGGDKQRLPGRLGYSGSTPSWYAEAVTTNGIWYGGPSWISPACDSERRLVWSAAILDDTGDSGLDGMLVRTNVTKPLNDGWDYVPPAFFLPPLLTPPAWNSQKQKQGCSIFPLTGAPTSIVVIDDGSVFVAQHWGGYNPWHYSRGSQGIVAKYSPWIDQEVTETYEAFNSNGVSTWGGQDVTIDGPVEDARVTLDYVPNQLITDGSNVWGTSSYYISPAAASIFRISGTSGELTHEMLFPGETVIDMVEGGVYLYALVGYNGYPAQPGDNRLVKLYKSNLSIVDEMDFPHAYSLISYDSETLWVKTAMHDGGTVDRMHKILKSLIGTPWWLAPSYPLGYTGSDGIERGARAFFPATHGRLSRGIPGSWGAHLIFVDIGDVYYRGDNHTLIFDPTTGYTDVLPIPGTGFTIMPEYGRGNQSGGAGFYGAGGSAYVNDTEYAFARYRFPKPLPPNSKIAIHDTEVHEGSYYPQLECSVLYERGNFIQTYYSNDTSGYLYSWDYTTNYYRAGIRRQPGAGYGLAGYQCAGFPVPSGVTEMRAMGTDIILYHNHQWVPNRPTGGFNMGSTEPESAPQYGNITVVPLNTQGGVPLSPSLRFGSLLGPWFTIDADIVCRYHNTGNRFDPLGMIFFDISSQNVYPKIGLAQAPAWADPGYHWYISGWTDSGPESPPDGRVFHLPDLSYTLRTNNPTLMKVAPQPYRDGNSDYASQFARPEPGWMLYMLSEDWGMSGYPLQYDYDTTLLNLTEVRISNDYSRARLVGQQAKELIQNSNGFLVLDKNNVVKKINVTPSPPTIKNLEALQITRVSVFGNADLVNVRFGPVVSNEKFSIMTWEFGDQTWGLDSGNGLYSNVGRTDSGVGSMDEFLAVFEGLTAGVTTWPPVGEVNHIYAPGFYTVKVMGFYGRAGAYGSPGYLGSRPWSDAAAPYNTDTNGSYLTGEIDASGIGDFTTKEMTLIIQSRDSATIGIQPNVVYGESVMDNGVLSIYMLPWLDAGPDVQRGQMFLTFFHISAYNDPYSNSSNEGWLELNFQFDGGQEQEFVGRRSWRAGTEIQAFEKSFVSNWAFDQQFIGNQFDLVARWRSAADSSIVSPPARLRVSVVGSDPGIAHWSLDHIEIGPNLR